MPFDQATDKVERLEVVGFCEVILLGSLCVVLKQQLLSRVTKGINGSLGS